MHKDLHEKFPRLASPILEMFVHGHDRGGKKLPKLKKLYTNMARSVGLKIVPDFKTNEVVSYIYSNKEFPQRITHWVLSF